MKKFTVSWFYYSLTLTCLFLGLASCYGQGDGSSLPLVVVTNGSAMEGYWSVFYLLKTGRVQVRATVRNLKSSNAQRLIDLEVEGRKCQVVEADNFDVDALTNAFEGARGIYATTVYNVDRKKKFDPDNLEELESARAMVQAAKNANPEGSSVLKNFLWQTMMRYKTHPPDLGLPIPAHYKTKWDMEKEIQESGLPWIFLRQPAYMRQFRFLLTGNRRLKSTHPTANKVGFVAEEDLGKIVATVLAPLNNDTSRFLGDTINALSELATPPEYAERAAAVVPDFAPGYKPLNPKFSKYLYKFLSFIVGGPVFPYIGAIMQNFGANNALDMYQQDLDYCQELTQEFGGLTTLEVWLQAYMTEEPHGNTKDIKWQTKFQKAGPTSFEL